MRLIRVAAGILNQTPLDWEGNTRRIVQAIEAARQAGVQVLCLPELCITGYGCEDAFHSPAVWEMAWQVLEEIAQHTQGLVVSLGLPVSYGTGLFDAAAVVCNGQVAGFAAKQHLSGDGIHYEPRWFKPWPAEVRANISVCGQRYPVGDLVFDCGGIRLGFEICEDAWVAERPGHALSRRGVELVLNPSASHFAFGKHAVRTRFVLEASRAFGVAYVYSNLAGNESGRAIYDGGALIASEGQLVAANTRFPFEEVSLVTGVVDLDATRRYHARLASFQPDVAELERFDVRVPFDWQPARLEALAPPAVTWEAGPHLKEEEFTRAVGLGLWDYMRKSRSRGFVVSLSGGADSSAVASLVSIMLRLAEQSLGMAGMHRALAYLKDIRQQQTAADLTRALLCCAYQSTRHSSATTRNAAEAVAQAVGADFHEFSVQELVDRYVQIGESALGRRLTWENDDVTLQNIQARARAPSVWLLANARGALLVATSNRSEAAVGYATMDGDTSGGLSPIAGLDKAYLRRWLVWLEKEGPAGLGPIPALAAVNVQPPTAELRPAAAAQTDEGDLMPYEFLDVVERAAIRDKLTPVEILARTATHFPQYSLANRAVWIERFFRLWCRNQWKRERYAPSFHLDDENLDPKTWCRFPILSGGYERELQALRAAAAKA